ncbi:hypothetical protein KUV80_14545 [Fictibacillus nanhaiensis]|uniref:hypothetical protein n=1 Tax=Fictibacillus nanhaiensis TaxID=742169 RepID=UPI001C944650|nr:hypothetical protein [Fictibacillus nanhaiensis]MBY6037889.1 hypothetical protein [Fictibacillus nanhaiensis]
MLHVQKEITLASMARTPQFEEDVNDFFIAYDKEHNPLLLLPTTKGFLPDGQLYAIAFLKKENNSYQFTLSDKIMPFNLDHATLIHDQLGFFFGPQNNMLESFFKGDTFGAYVVWSKNMVKQLINETLQNMNNTSDDRQREKHKNRLTLLLQA